MKPMQVLSTTTVGELFKEATFTAHIKHGAVLYFFNEDMHEIGYCPLWVSGNNSAKAYRLKGRAWSDYWVRALLITRIKP